MLINHRVWLIAIFGLLFLLGFIAVYNYGVDKGKEGIKNYIEASNNYKSALMRYKGLYIQECWRSEAWKKNCHGISNLDQVFKITVIK